MKDLNINDLYQVISQNSLVMKQVLEHLEQRDCPWCNPDEAARMLGLTISKSGNHRRVMAYLAKKGFIPKYRPGKPYMYWKEDVMSLAPKIATGEVSIPSKV